MTHPRHTETGEHAQDSTVGLVGGLIGDAKDLALAHLDGLRLELKEELRDLKTSIRLAAAAAAVFVVGALLAAIGIVQAVWLYTPLPSWAAYAIVGAVCFAAGAAVLVVRSRKSQDIDLVPDTGLARIERDAKWMARTVESSVVQPPSPT